MKSEEKLTKVDAYVLLRLKEIGSLLSLEGHYSSAGSGSSGFYFTLKEAQQRQLLESIAGNEFEIFHLEFPIESIQKG